MLDSPLSLRFTCGLKELRALNISRDISLQQAAASSVSLHTFLQKLDGVTAGVLPLRMELVEVDNYLSNQSWGTEMTPL